MKDPNWRKRPRPKRPIGERFFEKVNRTPTCWLWTSATWGSGYGFFWTNDDRRSEFAHRFSWELKHGMRPPKGMQVMHSCDNKLCVNPDHLSIGTAQDNTDDKVAKKRHCVGEKNMGGNKLTWDKAGEIRSLTGIIGCHRAAKIYGVSSQTIKMIRRNVLWKLQDMPT